MFKKITSAIIGIGLVLALYPDPAFSLGSGYFESDSVLRARRVMGSVHVKRGQHEDWETVYENMPLAEGYRLKSGKEGFIEVELSPITFVRIDYGSEILIRRVDSDSVRLRYISGGLYVSILGDKEEREVEIDFGPAGIASSHRVGSFRVDEEGPSAVSVSVREGTLRVRGSGREHIVREGERARLDGGLSFHRAKELDDWDALVKERDRDIIALSERGLIRENVQGRYEIERYGEWVDVPPYGVVWRPVTVGNGWKPYLYGRWVFAAPFGWTWVSSEPWGWVTYHYGYWAPVTRYGWVWVPAARYRSWYPARVRIVVRHRVVTWYPLRPGQRYVRIGRKVRHRRHKGFMGGYYKPFRGGRARGGMHAGRGRLKRDRLKARRHGRHGHTRTGDGFGRGNKKRSIFKSKFIYRPIKPRYNKPVRRVGRDGNDLRPGKKRRKVRRKAIVKRKGHVKKRGISRPGKSDDSRFGRGNKRPGGKINRGRSRRGRRAKNFARWAH